MLFKKLLIVLFLPALGYGILILQVISDLLYVCPLFLAMTFLFLCMNGYYWLTVSMQVSYILFDLVNSVLHLMVRGSLMLL